MRIMLNFKINIIRLKANSRIYCYRSQTLGCTDSNVVRKDSNSRICNIFLTLKNADLILI